MQTYVTGEPTPGTSANTCRCTCHKHDSKGGMDNNGNAGSKLGNEGSSQAPEKALICRSGDGHAQTAEGM